VKSVYTIVRCSNRYCGKFSYCKTGQKTKQCPYCNKRIDVYKKQIMTVNTPKQARVLVQEFNKELGKQTEPEWMSRSSPKREIKEKKK